MTAENPETRGDRRRPGHGHRRTPPLGRLSEAAEAGATESDDLSAITPNSRRPATELGYAKAEIANIRRKALARIDRAVEDGGGSVVSKFLDLVDDLDGARATATGEGSAEGAVDKLYRSVDGLGLPGSARRATRSPRICRGCADGGQRRQPRARERAAQGYRLGAGFSATAMVTVTDGEPAADAAAE